MEGRTIARSNGLPDPGLDMGGDDFNGGPDNCPAKPDDTAGADRRDAVTSMEGRTIARPNNPPRDGLGVRSPTSMEGRTIARPNRQRPDDAAGGAGTSMEGRTIARPNPTHGPSGCASPTDFNGGPDNCPAKPPPLSASSWERCYFNGGPDNCPAKPGTVWYTRERPSGLQWRAGQLPGQTRPAPGSRSACWRHFNGGPDNCPAKRDNLPTGPTPNALTSMEGRTIARPNPPWPSTAPPNRSSLQWRAGQLPGQTAPDGGPDHVRRILQWRAGQLPGQTTDVKHARHAKLALQWRAGQLPGQTPASAPSRLRRWRYFNGGPDNCPAKHLRRGRRLGGGLDTSMEGRTIARPNLDRDSTRSAARALQWRAGQLPGQTVMVRRRRRAMSKLQWRAGQLPGQT